MATTYKERPVCAAVLVVLDDMINEGDGGEVNDNDELRLEIKCK